MPRSCCLRWLALILFALLPALATAAPASLTAEQAMRELRILKRAFVDLHPGLYRYQSPAELDAAFASAQAQVAGGSDALRMYLIATRLAASIRCGHTWTNPLNQGASMQDALAQLSALPVRIRLLEGRLLVSASADPKLAPGDEILGIDGRSPAQLVREWLPYLRADGSSDGKRLSQIDSTVDGGAMDRLLPLLRAPVEGRYAVRIRRAGARPAIVSVAGMPVTQRERTLAAAGVPVENEAWRFVIEGDVATLTLPTFSFWRSDFDWKAFLQDSFDTLAARKVPALVIDLRQNEGGDDQIGRTLLAYLIGHPYRVPAGRVESAYERVPYDLARYLDTWDYGFFDRTGKVVRGTGRNWLLKEQPADRTVVPASRTYAGKVVALVGPRMSSAGFLVARDLQRSGAAPLVGQPTGGNLRGLNGGELAWVTLPYSGVAVDIPLIASFTRAPEPDRGIRPDLAVHIRLQDAARGVDTERVAALRWLRSRR